MINPCSSFSGRAAGSGHIYIAIEPPCPAVTASAVDSVAIVTAGDHPSGIDALTVIYSTRSPAGDRITDASNTNAGVAAAIPVHAVAAVAITPHAIAAAAVRPIDCSSG